MNARYFAVNLPGGRSSPLWEKFFAVAATKLGGIAPDYSGINNLVLLQFWRSEAELRHEFGSKPGNKKLENAIKIDEVTSQSSLVAPHAGYATSLNNYFKAGL